MRSPAECLMLVDAHGDSLAIPRFAASAIASRQTLESENEKLAASNVCIFYATK